MKMFSTGPGKNLTSFYLVWCLVKLQLPLSFPLLNNAGVSQILKIDCLFGLAKSFSFGGGKGGVVKEIERPNKNCIVCKGYRPLSSNFKITPSPIPKERLIPQRSTFVGI